MLPLTRMNRQCADSDKDCNNVLLKQELEAALIKGLGLSPGNPEAL